MLSVIAGCILLIVLPTACGSDPWNPPPPPPAPDPVGLMWGSGASGAFVEDTVPLVTFFRDSAGDPIGLPRPILTWTSSNPAVLQIVSESLAMALDTGVAVLTAISLSQPVYTLIVPLRVIPRWQGRLVWSRQPVPDAQPALAVREFPGHQVHQYDLGYPGAGSGDAYMSSDGRYALATGTRPIAPLANRTVFMVDLLTDVVQAPLDSLPGNQFSGAWFAGDTLLAFLMEAVTGYEVFTSRPDGSQVQQRTRLGQGTPPFFDLTPEGNLVLELHESISASDLFEVTLAGDTVRRLTSTPYSEGSPAVSPNGAMIAYGAAQGDFNHVWVMNRDGSNPRRLLPEVRIVLGFGPPFVVATASSSSPSWTGDSKFLLVSWGADAYLSADSSRYDVLGDLYAIRLEDGLAVQLTRTPTIDGQPFFR